MVERVLSLRLKGAARETYRQLSKEQRNEIEEIKSTLITDSFVTFDQFTTCRLRLEETVDEFQTDLQRLAQLLGQMPPECWMKSSYKWATESCQGIPPIVNQDGNPNFKRCT